jgi:ABC-type oligopeptide transport system ATPase subunit
LKFELEPTLQQAAKQAARAEHERTREWLENRGLPKAARVAQREAYNVLRNHGVISAANERARAELEVGRSQDIAEARALSSQEVKELAEMCIAMLETHCQSIDATLAEISSEAGGCLLPEDAPKVRDLAERMIQESRL